MTVAGIIIVIGLFPGRRLLKKDLIREGGRFLAREAIRGFAMRLKDVDDKYNECMSYVGKGQERETFCDRNALQETRSILMEYAEMVRDEIIGKQLKGIASNEPYVVLRKIIKLTAHRLAPEYEHYFDFIQEA